MHNTTIDAGKKLDLFDIKELFRYKDLFFTLAYREFRVRYAQTFLGFFWAFLQPAATLLIFTFVFGRAIKVDTGNIPYPVFALSGMVAWTYFSFVVSQSGRSLINSQSMIQKIYFPRIILPLSQAMVGLIDFFITFLLLLLAMLWYGVLPSAHIWYLPLFLLMAIVAALAVGIWISALTIRYRDFMHVIPFLIQIGLYATPVAYSTLYIPEKYHLLYYSLNPMVGVVEGFRWSLIGQGSIHPYTFISMGVVLVLFVTSLIYFRKVEKVMADII
ncbi:MAG: phosphate ABC transporter permease [Bacteroidetes bacterium HGW-Bacteroidetes-4]|jgi:lipopolysaccharide transport system permease protein|nr:MAG: phosphate ABC transporter permease [Bacteroidetes bacterium HGW-Bacteroidetes-4]